MFLRRSTKLGFWRNLHRGLVWCVGLSGKNKQGKCRPALITKPTHSTRLHVNFPLLLQRDHSYNFYLRMQFDENFRENS